MRVCRVCGESKPLAAFRRQRRTCRACDAEYNRRWWQQNAYRYCRKCERWFPVAEMAKGKQQCKDCANRVARQSIRGPYDADTMTEDMRRAMLYAHGSCRCYVCGEELLPGMTWRWYVGGSLQSPDEEGETVPAFGCDGHVGVVIEVAGAMYCIGEAGKPAQRVA